MKVLLLSENVPQAIGDREVILRHSHFTFLVDGISRACSHQLVRHRVASYSQQSQRYVAMRNFPYVTPDSIKGKTVNIDGKGHNYDELMSFIGKFYEALVDDSIPKEDARFILPNACTTRIIFTMNGEELVHFLRLRTCRRAQWEIRKMAIEMVKLLRCKYPKLFKNVGPNCYYLGYCTEGEKSCGRAEEIRAYFASLCKEERCKK